MDRITALLLAALVATIHADEFQSPGAVIKLGGRCVNNADCAIKNSLCNNVCACKDGFSEFFDSVGVLNQSVCAKALAHSCNDDTECFTNAKCIQNACNCDTDQGYVPSRDSSRCLHKSGGFNSSCQTSQQCPNWGDGTICSAAGLCTCMPTFHFYQDRCYFSNQLEARCVGDDKKRCYLSADGDNQHVTCNEKTDMCECVKGYKPSDDKTKCKIKRFDGSCDTNDDCTNAHGKQAECSHNKCKCKADHHLYNNTCCFNLVLGDQCDINGSRDHCYLPLDGDKQHVECGSSRICQCSHGYKPANNNRQCVSGSSSTASVSAFLLSTVILMKVASF